MRKWIVRIALAVVVGNIRGHRLLWPLAESFAGGGTLHELVAELASMTNTTFDDLLVKGSFRESLRLAIDAYDGPGNEGVALYDAFLSRIEEAAEYAP